MRLSSILGLVIIFSYLSYIIYLEQTQCIDFQRQFRYECPKDMYLNGTWCEQFWRTRRITFPADPVMRWEAINPTAINYLLCLNLITPILFLLFILSDDNNHFICDDMVSYMMLSCAYICLYISINTMTNPLIRRYSCDINNYDMYYGNFK